MFKNLINTCESHFRMSDILQFWNEYEYDKACMAPQYIKIQLFDLVDLKGQSINHKIVIKDILIG